MKLYDDWEKEVRTADDGKNRDKPVNLGEWSVHAIVTKYMLNDLAEEIEKLKANNPK